MMPPPRSSDSDTEQQSAMLLTDQEWDDLMVIATVYRTVARPDLTKPHTAAVYERCMALTDRIIEAAS